MILWRCRYIRLAMRRRALSPTGILGALAVMAVFYGVLVPRAAMALPLYARQTGQPCATCHTAFLELTPFGRRFKLGGYTLGGGDWKGPPFAVMLQPTFTHLQEPQPGGLAPGFGANNDFAMQQISLFTGGRITENSGAFIQGTYDGVAHRFGWDNADIRYARSVNIGGHTFLWGIDANNNPTVQDVWNTIPAWSFPYIRSAFAPMPTATPFINEVYAQQVGGMSAYGFLDDTFYLEFGGYRSLSNSTQLALGVDTFGQSPIGGTAPYWRAAVEKNIGNHSLEMGTFGLAARVLPMRLSQVGLDSFTDVGVDTQYQYLGDPHTVTFRGAWIHENHNTSASQALGLADNSNDQLQSLNVSASYIYDKTWSLTAGRVSVGGTADATLYGTTTGSPNSAGWIFEIAYLPFSHGGPAFWPWLNFRIGLQYTRWTKFDGSTDNIDGMGRSANANNTLFLYVWTMF
ncbi:MAG: cytochrome C [Alphaproteobacteria bacterium]|nr:cytochrome C [Alphaproteobacteria bacterium]